MIPITVAEWQNMNESCKMLYQAYIEAQVFDLYLAATLFNKHNKYFHEDFFLKNVIVDSGNWNFIQYIQVVARSREKACGDMQRLLFFRRMPVEFFQEQSIEEYGPDAEEIIAEYRYQKKLAHALLHR